MNKDVMLNVKIDEVRTTKYFQPVITNNTVIIPAKRLQDNISETSDKSSVYKNITTQKTEKVEPRYKNLVDNNSAIINEMIVPVNNEEKKDELKIEEIVIEESKEQNATEEFKMKLEDMARIFEENQRRDNNNLLDRNSIKENDIKENVELENCKEENNVKENFEKENIIKEYTNTPNSMVQENQINKDITKKMDLPYEDGMKTESVPQRREMVDNLNEMKAKLFLLASNAKKPVRICVNKKVFLMGSDYAKMDCVIRNNRYISRCHAKIYYEASCYFIEDVGSMNGTFINGVKLAEGIKYKLETGDIINLADCKFEVDIKN